LQVSTSDYLKKIEDKNTCHNQLIFLDYSPILKMAANAGMKMDDIRQSNYNSCDNTLCKVTRQSLCHCVILFPLGCYCKKTLLVNNKSSTPICAKVDGEIKWIKPNRCVRFYNDRDHPRINGLFTEKKEPISFSEETAECSCEYYLCPFELCKIC
jgi:hypothetical protein